MKMKRTFKKSFFMKKIFIENIYRKYLYRKVFCEIKSVSGNEDYYV